jgi:hypothetical protein
LRFSMSSRRWSDGWQIMQLRQGWAIRMCGPT